MLTQLTANLGRYGLLLDDDRRAIADLGVTTRRLAAGEDIVLEGDSTSNCHILISGQAFRHRTLADGRRQIMTFNIPGDVCDIEGLLLGIDYGVCALSPCEVALAPHAAMEALLDAHPRLARALWRTTLVDGAIFREWMVGIGRRTAKARIAHLFCEMFTRLRAAGLVEKNRCRFAATQTHLSDALGLSVVHTNRVLQELRGEGLIAFKSGELTVLNWPGLQAAGEFEPSYLHLNDRRR